MSEYSDIIHIHYEISALNTARIHRLLTDHKFRKIPRWKLNSALYLSSGIFSLVQDSGIGDNSDPAFNAFLESSQAKTEFESGYGATVAAGILLKKRFRIEIEYAYKGFDADQGSLIVNGTTQTLKLNTEHSVNSVLINTVFDWRNSSRFTPYIGVGLGIGFVEFFQPPTTVFGINLPETQAGDSAVTYQFFGGVNYWITRNLLGFLGYKYFATDELIYGVATMEELNHTIWKQVCVFSSVAPDTTLL